MTVTLEEANTQFAALVARAVSGEEVIISDGQNALVRMVSVGINSESRPRRVPGSAKGKVIIAEDFNAPLPEDILEGFAG